MSDVNKNKSKLAEYSEVKNEAVAEWYTDKLFTASPKFCFDAGFKAGQETTRKILVECNENLTKEYLKLKEKNSELIKKSFEAIKNELKVREENAKLKELCERAKLMFKNGTYLVQDEEQWLKDYEELIEKDKIQLNMSPIEVNQQSHAYFKGCIDRLQKALDIIKENIK